MGKQQKENRMKTFLIIYQKSPHALTNGWLCRAEDESEARYDFPFPVNVARIIAAFDITGEALDAVATLEAADKGEYDNNKWLLEVRKSLTGNEIATYPFDGNEKKAMEEAHQRLLKTQRALEIDVEMLVINQHTSECVYQGSFGVCPSYNDIHTKDV